MKLTDCVLLVLASSIVITCGGGGGGPLSPRGGECGVAPTDICQIDKARSDEQRFAGLKSLAKQLQDNAHPLHNATLVGGEQEHPIGKHVETVAVIMSTWDVGENSNDPLAVRRRPEGNLHNVAERLRCAADRLIALGPSAKDSELVCWSLELWRVGRAYTQLASK